MNKNHLIKCGAFNVALGYLLLTPLPLHSAQPEAALYLQVRSSKLRSKPEFWSAPLADLSYGATMTPLGAAPTDKSWLKVKYESQEGFVHVSSVTRRKVIFNANASAQAGKSVDQSSVVMAGKGFNKQIENKFGSAKGLDFAAVDEVEKTVVDPVVEAAFVHEGKLSS